MAAQNYSEFPTAIGPCIIGWAESGILAVQLPQTSRTRTLERLRKRCPDAMEEHPTAIVQRAIDEMTSLLAGDVSDLRDINLDMAGIPDLEREIYEIARSVPPGSTTTYGDVAKRLGDVRLSREVGQAMATNPFAIVVPCHRILSAGNKLGGFSAQGGPDLKYRMLGIEGAYVNHTPSLF